jgi:hypothetical protein
LKEAIVNAATDLSAGPKDMIEGKQKKIAA